MARQSLGLFVICNGTLQIAVLAVICNGTLLFSSRNGKLSAMRSGVPTPLVRQNVSVETLTRCIPNFSSQHMLCVILSLGPDLGQGAVTQLYSAIVENS